MIEYKISIKDEFSKRIIGFYYETEFSDFTKYLFGFDENFSLDEIMNFIREDEDSNEFQIIIQPIRNLKNFEN